MSTATHPTLRFPVDMRPACTAHPELFHAPDGTALEDQEAVPEPSRARREPPAARRARIDQAVELCLDCPLMLACRDWARATGAPGVAGGESEGERVAAGFPPHPEPAAEESEGPGTPLPCGTEGAARRHHRRGELLDPACAQAQTAARRVRTAQSMQRRIQQWPPRLRPKETAILAAWVSGMDRAALAAHFGLPRKSISKYMSGLRQALRVDDDTALAAAARKAGLLPATPGGYAKAA